MRRILGLRVWWQDSWGQLGKLRLESLVLSQLRDNRKLVLSLRLSAVVRFELPLKANDEALERPQSIRYLSG